MDLKPQLIPKLKALRLSGILETLDVRNRQAIEEKLAYVEFLERLLEVGFATCRTHPQTPPKMSSSNDLSARQGAILRGRGAGRRVRDAERPEVTRLSAGPSATARACRTADPKRPTGAKGNALLAPEFVPS